LEQVYETLAMEGAGMEIEHEGAALQIAFCRTNAARRVGVTISSLRGF